MATPSASLWKETVARRLRELHLDTLRGKILVFAVLVTLVPSLATTLASYGSRRRSLDTRVTLELSGASAEAARVADAWLTERLSDLRLRASSYVVTENIARVSPRSDGAQALLRLRDFLNSVRERYPDHVALFVLDPRGRVVATSAGRAGRVQLPLDRINTLRTGNALLGDAYWDATLGKAAVMVALPIRDPDGRLLGALAAKMNLQSLADLLQQVSPGERDDVFLMTEQGRLIIRSDTSSAELMRTRLPEASTNALFDAEGARVVYRRADGRDAVGTLRQVPQLRWAAVAEIPRAEVLRQVSRLRTVTTMTVVGTLVAVALLAYGVGLVVVRPLERLTSAAAKVAAGDLSVELPAGGSGEVGYLTRAFSHLVSRLRERENQGELEKLSVTDALTGLYNRRHLVGTLANEVQRSRRLRRTFSVLLADVDHFKRYNDTYGHLAGDSVLVKIAEILRKTTRGVDSVARYGGEEFLVMLLEAPLATALLVAERIRARVAAEEFGGDPLSVSIGVAEYPAHGDTPEELIASADAAMYQAKGEGRNRAVAAGERAEPEKEKKRRRKGEA
ncbi:MAG TPA: diguanylate cyclase [Gemmatimonadales bacterium]